MKNYLIFGLGVLVVSVAQTLLKLGTTSISGTSLSLDYLFKLIANKYLIAGFLLYGFGSLLWIYILSKFPLSIAYPAMSLSYIFILLLSYFFLHETINLSKVIGMGLIFLGIIFLFKNL